MYLTSIAQIPLGSSRLDTFDMSSKSRRACRPQCSNIVDDEQAIVLTCTSFLVVFMILHTQILFVPSNKM